MATIGRRSMLDLMLFVRANIRAGSEGVLIAERLLHNGEWQTAWFTLLESVSLLNSIEDLVSTVDVEAQEALADAREAADRLAARIAFGGFAYPEEPQYHEERGTT